MQFAHNGFYKGSIPFGLKINKILNNSKIKFYITNYNFNYSYKKYKLLKLLKL